MARPLLEVADVFRAHGAAWRKANAGHVSLAQLKVMSAIETCRTAALGGHVERCEDCAHQRIAYNSCRNRHWQYGICHAFTHLAQWEKAVEWCQKSIATDAGTWFPYVDLAAASALQPRP